MGLRSGAILYKMILGNVGVERLSLELDAYIQEINAYCISELIDHPLLFSMMLTTIISSLLNLLFFFLTALN